MYSNRLTTLGVLSETTALIAYLVNGYISNLAAMVPDQVNVYSAAAFRVLISNSVTAVVNSAVTTSSNMLVPKNLNSMIQQAYLNGMWAGAFASQPPRQREGRYYGASYPAAFKAAVEVLTPNLLARWVPPTQATGAAPGVTVNVDTAGAQNTVNQNAAASGASVAGKSFLDSYGIYVAAALLLLLILDKGK